MITPYSGNFTKSSAFLEVAAKAEAVTKLAADHEARLSATESRLEDHHASLTEAITDLRGRLEKMEQGTIKARFIACVSRIRQGFRN